MASSSDGSSGPSRAMGLGRAGALGLVLGLLLGVLGGAASEPHSLRYFYTAVSDPSPGVPQFVTVGYVDGHLIDHYDSETQRDEPGADWFAANTDQQYWDRENETLRGAEQIFRVGLNTLREHYNQSSGSHTVQYVCGCDIGAAVLEEVLELYSSDGKDSLTSDKDKQTYTEADAEDQITKSNCKAHGSDAEQMKCRMANTCTKILDHPEVQVSRMEANNFLTFSNCTYDLSSPEPQSNLNPIVVGVAVIVMAVIATLAGFAVRKWKQAKKGKGYNVAPGSEGGSSCSTTGSNLSV